MNKFANTILILNLSLITIITFAKASLVFTIWYTITNTSLLYLARFHYKREINLTRTNKKYWAMIANLLADRFCGSNCNHKFTID